MRHAVRKSWRVLASSIEKTESDAGVDGEDGDWYIRRKGGNS